MRGYIIELKLFMSKHFKLLLNEFSNYMCILHI